MYAIAEPDNALCKYIWYICTFYMVYISKKTVCWRRWHFCFQTVLIFLNWKLWSRSVQNCFSHFSCFVFCSCVCCNLCRIRDSSKGKMKLIANVLLLLYFSTYHTGCISDVQINKQMITCYIHQSITLYICCPQTKIKHRAVFLGSKLCTILMWRNSWQ